MGKGYTKTTLRNTVGGAKGETRLEPEATIQAMAASRGVARSRSALSSCSSGIGGAK